MEPTETLEQESSSARIAHLEKQLKDQKLIFNHMLEGSMAGYWDWMIKENTEYLSPTFKRMFGYAEDEMENTPEAWQRIIFQEDLPKVFETFETHVASKGEIPYSTELRYHHKDGSTVWVYCRGKVIEWDDEGQPVRMIGSHVDITPLKNQEERKRELESVIQKNKALEHFAFLASHDLQEPLRTVSSLSEVLMNRYGDELDAVGQECLKHIEASTERMRELIKGLLDFSRLGRNAELSKVDMQAIMDQVAEDLDEVIQQEGAEMSYENLPKVCGTEMELRILMQNLIQNAIKFRSADSPIVSISHAPMEDFHVFRVKDNGIGIDSKHQERIFDLFQRLNKREDYPGIGIGLAHCRRIVELHDGYIKVESQLGEGSCFEFGLSRNLGTRC
jgi:PAS domain S-box-containing protein